MLIRTILKLHVILLVLENIQETFAQSLFDDLPQNGALIVNHPQNTHKSHKASNIQSDRNVLKPTLKLSSSSGNLHNIRDTITTRKPTQGKAKLSKENVSLFDSLPNQGALTLSGELNPSRNTRDSGFNQQISQDFVPINNDFTFFERHIPNIQHRVVSPTIVPVITGPTSESSTIIPIISNKYNQGYNNHQYHTISKDEFEDSSHSSTDSGKKYISATAKSGGPTVIVYAHPHTNKGSQNPNSEQGALPPAPPPERNNIPGRNEIHYHYHLPSTTTHSPNHYGSTQRPPNRQNFQSSYNNHHNQGNEHHNHQNQHHDHHNQHNNNQNQHHNEHNEHHNHQPNRPPSSQYGAPQPPPSTTRRPSSSGGGSYPSSRLNTAGISLTEDKNDNDFNHRTFFTPAKYQSSEGYHSSDSHSGWQPKTTAAPLSLSYESPPSFDAPQPPPSYSYDSSPGYAPPPSYGPPPQTPPPSPAQQNDPPLPPSPAPPTESHQTSISYQTIPVTHQVTEFVQVPTITQTLINHTPILAPATLPAADGFPAPADGGRPSSQYGPPNPGRTLNVQTAQNPSTSRASDRSLIAEDQLNRLLLSSSPTSRENSLSDLLLLTQGGRGSNDLSLVELQLLAAATRGNGYSNNNFQNPILNPLRGGRGRFSNSLPVVNSGFRTNGPLGNNLNSFAFANGNGGLRNFGFQGSNFNGNQFSNQQVTGTDTATAIHELIREQRIQGALNDLRSRLRDQSRGADRERQNYRNLFYKGALLLSALTLLPTVATPMAAAAAANSAGAASVLPSFMMPLTIGRRKRSVFGNPKLTPFEKCLENIKIKLNIDSDDLKKTYHPSFHQWLNCSNKLGVQFATKSFDLVNNSRIAHENSKNPKSMLQLPILESNQIRDDLRKYLPIEDIILNSKCIQKYFCTNLLAIKKATHDENIYPSMFGITNNNMWIKEAFEAAKKNMCNKFLCSEDEIK